MNSIYFYKVTGNCWVKPMYYAGYNSDLVKNQCEDNNFRDPCEFKVENVRLIDIPPTKFIQNGGLNNVDSEFIKRLRP